MTRTGNPMTGHGSIDWRHPAYVRTKSGIEALGPTISRADSTDDASAAGVEMADIMGRALRVSAPPAYITSGTEMLETRSTYYIEGDRQRAASLAVLPGAWLLCRDGDGQQWKRVEDISVSDVLLCPVPQFEYSLDNEQVMTIEPQELYANSAKLFGNPALGGKGSMNSRIGRGEAFTRPSRLTAEALALIGAFLASGSFRIGSNGRSTRCMFSVSGTTDEGGVRSSFVDKGCDDLCVPRMRCTASTRGTGTLSFETTRRDMFVLLHYLLGTTTYSAKNPKFVDARGIIHATSSMDAALLAGMTFLTSGSIQVTSTNGLMTRFSMPSWETYNLAADIMEARGALPSVSARVSATHNTGYTLTLSGREFLTARKS